MNPRSVNARFAGLKLAALAGAMFAKSIDAAAVAAVQAKQLHWTYGLRRGQPPARGILGGPSVPASMVRIGRRKLVQQFGRRQALKLIKADRRAVKAGAEDRVGVVA